METDKIAGLKERILENRTKNAEKALEYCKELLELAKEQENISLLGYTYYYLGLESYILNKAGEMFYNIGKALGYLNESEQWELLVRCYNLMAIMSVTQGNAAVGLDYYLTGISISKEHHVYAMLGGFYMNIGSLYLENGLYHEALDYFEKAQEYYPSNSKNFVLRKNMIYTNMATCYMLRGNLEKTREYIEKMDTECEPYYEDVDYAYVDCMKAEFYNICGDYEKRDYYIEGIRKRLQTQIQVMDIFDDLYHFCNLLLDIDRDDVLEEIIVRLEPMVEKTEIPNLQRKLVSLKLKYFRKNGMESEYLREGVRFYELTEIMEKDSQNIIANILYVRGCLERENERRKQMELVQQELQVKSETDPLTGMSNRYRLNVYLEEVLEKCLRRKAPMALEILDIDYFKEYNDNYGHLAGDECICEVAELLKKMENDRIFCARYGGDEFIILYHDMTLEEVKEKALHLRTDIMKANMKHDYSKTANVVTISQGICYSVPVQENKNWDYLHAADTMLYNIKKKSRNDVCIGNIRKEILFPKEL